MNLIVSRCEVAAGEQPRVIFYRVLRSLNQLIEAHNELVRQVAPEKPPVDARSFIGQAPTHVNDPQDVIDLLFQMRYVCRCVAPIPHNRKFAVWCDDCKRLIQEDN